MEFKNRWRFGFGWILPHRDRNSHPTLLPSGYASRFWFGRHVKKIDEHALQHPLVFVVGPLRGNSKFSDWRWNITILPPPSLTSSSLGRDAVSRNHHSTPSYNIPCFRVADHLKIRWLASLAWPPPLSNLMRGHFSSKRFRSHGAIEADADRR
jgi:hypothetical protein